MSKSDTQDYIRGRILLLKGNSVYFDVGEKDGVSVGNPFEIYYDQRNVANGQIIWSDRNISKSGIIDSLTFIQLLLYNQMEVKIRLHSPQANRGGFVDIMLFSEPHLDPAEIITPDDLMLGRLLHRGLITKYSEGRYVPDIVGDYEIRDLTYTFYINPEVKFHSGKPIEAADVAYSLEQLALSKQLTPATNYILEIKGVQDFRYRTKTEISGIFIIDKNTLSVTLRRPFPAFEEYLCGPGGYIIPKPGPGYAGAAITGAGMYKIKWRNLNGIALEPFESAEQSAVLDSIRFIRYRDLEEATLSFELGRLDIIPLLGEPPLKFVSSGNYTSLEQFTINSAIIGINSIGLYGKDANFSKALALILDRDAIIRVILGNSATPPRSNISGYEGRIPTVAPVYDPDSADFYLRQITIPNTPLYFYVDSNYPSLLRVARFIEGQLINKGLKVEEKMMDFRDLWQYADQNKIDLYLTCFAPISSEPDCIVMPLFSKTLSGQTNFLNYENYDFQSALELFRSTNDSVIRDSLLYDISNRLGDHSPVVTLYHPNFTIYCKADINNLKIDKSGYLDLRKVFIESRK